LENISAFAIAELEDIHFKHYIILTTSTGIDNKLDFSVTDT